MINVKRKRLTKKAVSSLVDISTRAVWDESTSIRRRTGENGLNNLSMYKTWKWYKINRADKATIIDVTPTGVWDKTFLFFFRKYDAGVGLLDTMTNWVNTRNITSFVAVALGDNQQILVDGELHELNSGDSITFNITHAHSVPKVKTDALWAIWMIVQ